MRKKIKRGPDRLDIARLRPRDDVEPAISGGYIIKKDDQGRGERGLLTGQEFRLRFEEPRESELTPVQRLWMTQYLDAFERALFGRDFRDPIAGYPAYLEVGSFIDCHWLVEVAKNADGYWYSQYMHKDRGVIAVIEGITTGLEEAHQRNGNRWERAGGNAALRARHGLTLANEVQALKEWLVSRLTWIDGQEYPRPVAHVSWGPPGVMRMSMAGLAGRIYYTTDGTDPRARGGGPSPTAAEFREPIEVMATHRVIRIRARSEFGLWSAPVIVDLPPP